MRKCLDTQKRKRGRFYGFRCSIHFTPFTWKKAFKFPNIPIFWFRRIDTAWCQSIFKCSIPPKYDIRIFWEFRSQNIVTFVLANFFCYLVNPPILGRESCDQSPSFNNFILLSYFYHTSISVPGGMGKGHFRQ